MTATEKVSAAAVGLLAATLVVLFIWAAFARSVANDRRTHEEHLREIEVCRTATSPADCFHRLSLP